MAKLLIHVADGERRVVDADSVYYAEAVAGDTVIRRRGAKPLRDVRELGEVERAWKRHGFVRIHDNHLVNPDKVLRVRKVGDSRNWEVKMMPPVNAVLAVSRRRLAALWRAFDE
jgi:DNA-binding LytR/AlgR family response regulator